MEVKGLKKDLKVFSLFLLSHLLYNNNNNNNMHFHLLVHQGDCDCEAGKRECEEI